MTLRARTRRMLAALALALAAAGSAPAAKLPVAPAFGKAPGKPNTQAWFRPERASEVVAVEAGVAGDRVATLVDSATRLVRGLHRARHRNDRRLGSAGVRRRWRRTGHGSGRGQDSGRARLSAAPGARLRFGTRRGWPRLGGPRCRAHATRGGRARGQRVPRPPARRRRRRAARRLAGPRRTHRRTSPALGRQVERRAARGGAARCPHCHALERQRGRATLPARAGPGERRALTHRALGGRSEWPHFGARCEPRPRFARWSCAPRWRARSASNCARKAAVASPCWCYRRATSAAPPTSTTPCASIATRVAAWMTRARRTRSCWRASATPRQKC